MKRIEVGVFSRMFRVWMKTLKSKCVLLTLIVTAVELCVARSATAQCYTFQAGDEASLVINIQNLPAPTVDPYLGTVRYDYNLKNLGGNKAIVTVNGSSYSSTELGGFGISVFSDPTGGNVFGVSVTSDWGNLGGYVVLSGAAGTFFQKGLPAVLPAASQWRTLDFAIVYPGGSANNLTVTSITSSCTSSGTNDGADNSDATNVKQADFTGDGTADYAVWRPSDGAWYVTRGYGGSLLQQWGLPGDVPVSGDYDRDGKTDYAVWRPSDGTWYVILSSDPTTPVTQQWGLPDDTPVPGDYDGDGKTVPCGGLLMEPGTSFSAAIRRHL